MEGLATVPWNTNLSNEAESQRIDTRGVSTVYNTPFQLSRLQRILMDRVNVIMRSALSPKTMSSNHSCPEMRLGGFPA